MTTMNMKVKWLQQGRTTQFLVAVVLVIGLVLAAGIVLADSVAIDFESYTAGPVNGQDGWLSTGPFDRAIVDSTGYGYAGFGTKSLRMSNAVASSSFGDQTFSKPVVDEAGETTAYVDAPSGMRQPYFEAEWEFASTVPGAQQPGLSVVASPDNGTGGRMSWIQMADMPGGLEVNFYDYQDVAPYGSLATPADGQGVGDDFFITNLATALDRSVPHKIKIEMFLVDGPHNDIVRVYVDDTLRHTGTSWEDYFRWVQGPGDPEQTAPVRESRTVRTMLFRTSVAAPATAGKGFLIDNLSLSSTLEQCTVDCYVDAVNGNDAFGGTNSTTDAKKTIQAAVNQVSAGGTVHVTAGTYNESPNIDKSLTLQSSNGRDATTINLQSGPTYLGALTISGQDVTVQGFTIVGADAVGGGLASTDIYLTSDPNNVSILDNRIKVGLVGSGSNGDDGFGVITEYNESSDVAQLTVTGNIFEPVNTAGTRAFYINPGVNGFVFQNNVITGEFTRNAISQAKNGLVDNNQITGAGNSGGIGTWGYPDPDVYGKTTFSNNTVSATKTAISINETNNVSLLNNVLENNETGVKVINLASFSGDLIASSVTAHFNSFEGNGTGILNDYPNTSQVDATNNWWGAASGPSHSSNSSGTGNSVSDNVIFNPWLGAETSAVSSGTPSANDSVSLPGNEVVAQNTGSGSPTIVVAKYTGNPSTVGTFVGSGSYYDINVTGTADLDGATLTITMPGTGSLNYYDGTAWKAVVGVGGPVTASGGVFTFVLNNTSTTPRLYQLTGTAFAGSSEQIRITPSRTVIAAGETFQVVVDAASNGLFGVDVSMSFDTIKLAVTSIALGKGISPTGLEAETVAKNEYDNGTGTLRFAYSQKAPNLNVNNVNLVLATITFSALAPGDTNVTMGSALFTNKDGTPATPGFLDSPIALTIDPSPSVVATVQLQGRTDHSGATLELVPTTTGNVLIDPSSSALGALDFDIVPAATYGVRIDAAKYLAAAKNVTIAPGANVVNLTASPLRLLGGDINGDDRINIQDLVLIGASFGETINLGADINNDGVVNIQDLAIAAGNFGKVTADYGSW